MSRQEEKGSTFRAMHSGDPFVIPNPWDVGSARVLEALGFRALATTSSGFAFTLGLVDGRVTLDLLVERVANRLAKLERLAHSLNSVPPSWPGSG